LRSGDGWSVRLEGGEKREERSEEQASGDELDEWHTR
jgi:hypothetical protein